MPFCKLPTIFCLVFTISANSTHSVETLAALLDSLTRVYTSSLIELAEQGTFPNLLVSLSPISTVLTILSIEFTHSVKALIL
jgi:hypothetical protein